MAGEVGIVLLTQGRQGDCLLASAAHIFGEWPPNVSAVSLLGTERRSDIEEQLREAAGAMPKKNGVLIMCDLFGSTQANVAAAFSGARGGKVACVSGLNLAMLLEAVNRRHLPLADMRREVIAAGRSAVAGGGG